MAVDRFSPNRKVGHHGRRGENPGRPGKDAKQGEPYSGANANEAWYSYSNWEGGGGSRGAEAQSLGGSCQSE